MMNESNSVMWGEDAGHRLITVRPDLESRLNRKAKELKRLDSEADSNRIRALTVEISALLFQVFAVKGQGVVGGFDDTFLDLSKQAIDSYDLSIGKPFSHFFRYLYARRKKNPTTRDEQFNKGAISWESFIEGHGDVIADSHAGDEWSGLPNQTFEPDKLSNAEIVEKDNNAVEVEFARLMALIVGYFEHATDKRDYTEEKKLYIRLFFTEAMTRLVKTRALVDECEPFERHEQEIFSSLELPFQDAYMVDICRAVREIWRADLKPEHKAIKPGDYSWKLSNGFILGYLADAHNVVVSGPAISQQRKNFKRLALKIGLPDKQIVSAIP